VSVRPARPEDRAAVYEVCLRTADLGADASGLVNHPDLIGDVFAGPYLRLCPELAFVVEDAAGVAGYVVGAADTEAFVDAYRREWLPSVTVPDGPRTELDERYVQALLRPERMLRPGFEDHPSHLHINLLPRTQRQGHGRRLIETFCDALRRAGSPGVHLGVGRGNEGARAFYARVGFRELSGDDHAVYLGLSIMG
jgi:ribosomal protein S18 acetylase RimI-like enzyme